jgi:hypothetical protein
MWLRLTGNAVSPSGHAIGEWIRCLSAFNLSIAVLSFAEHQLPAQSLIENTNSRPKSNYDLHTYSMALPEWAEEK